jgi:hypothetical protein
MLEGRINYYKRLEGFGFIGWDGSPDYWFSRDDVEDPELLKIFDDWDAKIYGTLILFEDSGRVREAEPSPTKLPGALWLDLMDAGLDPSRPRPPRPIATGIRLDHSPTRIVQAELERLELERWAQERGLPATDEEMRRALNAMRAREDFLTDLRLAYPHLDDKSNEQIHAIIDVLLTEKWGDTPIEDIDAFQRALMMRLTTGG